MVFIVLCVIVRELVFDVRFVDVNNFSLYFYSYGGNTLKK